MCPIKQKICLAEFDGIIIPTYVIGKTWHTEYAQSGFHTTYVTYSDEWEFKFVGWRENITHEKIMEVWVNNNLPDYLTDLNSLHELELRLSHNIDNGLGQSQADRFFYQLCMIANTSFPISATASQRAEAILKAIGKWEWKSE